METYLLALKRTITFTKNARKHNTRVSAQLQIAIPKVKPLI